MILGHHTHFTSQLGDTNAAIVLHTAFVYIVPQATSCNRELNAEEHCNCNCNCDIKAVKMHGNRLVKFNAIQMQSNTIKIQCNITANVVVRVPLLCGVPMQ